ncbi:hypothetical protein OF83DRAFT_1114032 [Amylostereum chailletii]|nr:hypothetical protein OF83DRAFT_1114032 [Amylostereum chailletii]
MLLFSAPLRISFCTARSIAEPVVKAPRTVPHDHRLEPSSRSFSATLCSYLSHRLESTRRIQFLESCVARRATRSRSPALPPGDPTQI